MGVWEFDFAFLQDPGQIALSTVGTVFAVALCSGGGIGGGGILVPLYILLDGLDEHHAIPLSKVVIFGAAFTDFWLYRDLRHPVQKWRSLINYDLAVIMEPLILFGTVVGVFLNVLLPPLIIGVLLIILLTYTAYRMFAKAKQIREKEKIISASRKSRASQIQNPNQQPLLSAAQQHSDEPPARDERWEKYPFDKNVWLVISWICILSSAVLKNTMVDCGSYGYWLLQWAPAPILAVITWGYGKRILREHKDRTANSYVKGDIIWDENNVIKYPIMSSIAGVAAALLGVGGGMVTGPLMLELGVIPEVSRVTSAYMILFTSSCTSMQYLLLGRIEADQAIWYMAWGFIGAVCGHHCVEYLLKKYNSTSVLVYLLAWAVLASAIGMGAVDVVAVVKDGFTGFSGAC
jgi:uncharacterized membrane protein YfcA